MIINVIGLGYIGLPTMLILASCGFDVVGTDIDNEKVKTLASGKAQFKESGIEELYQGSVTLVSGANSLYDGTSTLRNGISTYNNEGIKVLSSYSTKAKTYPNKLEALTKLTDEYKGFASNNTNTTTFVSVIK